MKKRIVIPSLFLLLMSVFVYFFVKGNTEAMSNSGIYFDKNNHFVISQPNIFNKEMTFEFWTKPESRSSNMFLSFVVKGEETTKRMYFDDNNSSGSLRIYKANDDIRLVNFIVHDFIERTYRYSHLEPRINRG